MNDSNMKSLQSRIWYRTQWNLLNNSKLLVATFQSPKLYSFFRCFRVFYKWHAYDFFCMLSARFMGFYSIWTVFFQYVCIIFYILSFCCFVFDTENRLLTFFLHFFFIKKITKCIHIMFCNININKNEIKKRL